MDNFYPMLLAGLCIFVGQVVRALRVQLIFGTGKTTSFRIIFLSIITSSFVSLLLPFRIGDLMRIGIMSLNRHVTFARASGVFLIDRMTDVTFLFSFSVIAFYFSEESLPALLVLVFFSLTIIVLFAILFLAKPTLRRLLFSSLPSLPERHRQRVQFGIYWMISRVFYCFTTFNFVLLTVVMWAFYLAGLYLAFEDHSVSTILSAISDVGIIFETDIIRFANLGLYTNNLSINAIAAALGMLLVLGCAASPLKSEGLSHKIQSTLTRNQSSMHMLETLFSERANFINCVLMRDINLIMLGKTLAPPPLKLFEAHLGGSGAIIVSYLDSSGQPWVRKYAERPDLCSRLEQQYKAISELTQHGLLMSKAENLEKTHSHTKYDMKQSDGFVSFPKFALNTTNNGAIAQNAVMSAIESICDLGLEAVYKTNDQDVYEYVSKKLITNVETAFNRTSSFIPKIKTASGTYAIELLLNKAWAERQIVYRKQSLIHGDPTLENLIIHKDGAHCLWIDPNPNQIFSTVLVDMAKLMQSLHYGYDFHEEFLKTNTDLLINSKHFKPKIYYALEAKLCNLLTSRYGPEGLRETYFHELIHYARLVNYKYELSQHRGDQYLALLETLVAEYVETFDER